MSEFQDERPADPSEDSEIDFDDEQEDDQSPLDEAEAAELGAELDDPEELSETEDEDEGLGTGPRRVALGHPVVTHTWGSE